MQRFNVILVGDFHQFPPVASKSSASSYWPCHPEETMCSKCLDANSEQFDTVVRLKTQVRVTAIQSGTTFFNTRGTATARNYISMSRSLVLVTNKSMTLLRFTNLGTTLVICPAFDVQKADTAAIVQSVRTWQMEVSLQ